MRVRQARSVGRQPPSRLVHTPGDAAGGNCSCTLGRLAGDSVPRAPFSIVHRLPWCLIGVTLCNSVRAMRLIKRLSIFLDWLERLSAGKATRAANFAVVCHKRPTRTLGRVPILRFYLTYAESKRVTDGARTRVLRSHNPPSPVSRCCHTFQNRLI